MSTRVVPQTAIVTCDACNVVCHDNIGCGRRRRSGVLSIKASGTDHLGDPVCDASKSIDLCDECLGKLETAIDNAIAAIRKEKTL